MSTHKSGDLSCLLQTAWKSLGRRNSIHPSGLSRLTDYTMTDHAFDTPNRQPTSTPQELKPGERLFVFFQPSDSQSIACDLIFHGQRYGWEVRFSDRRGLIYSRGGFVAKALAVQWAEEERKAIENGPAWKPEGVMSFDYVRDKLFEAVDILLLGDGDARSRLKFAAFYLIRLRGNDAPFAADSDMRRRFDRVMARVTNTRAIADEGTIEASIRRMDNDEIANVMREILAIYLEVEIQSNQREN
jgi:hypothetical protein